MLKVSNKSTRKKCEIFPGRNYSDKKIWGEILWWLISGGGGGYCLEENYLGVIV